MSWFSKLFGSKKMEKIATVRSLGVRFEIAKVDDSSCGYGEACWRVFWQAVNKDLLAGTILRDGDTNATPDRENVYCLSITRSDDSDERMSKVREALESSELYATVAANPRFVEGDHLIKEPLVEDGYIDLSGNFVGQSYRARVAFEAVKKGGERTGEAEQTHLREKKAQFMDTSVGNDLDCLIAGLKSSDSSERRRVAEALGDKKDKRSLNPLFEALMNWKEEENAVQAISIALFKCLWVNLDQGVQRSILDIIGGGNMLLLSILMGKIVSVQVLGVKDMNAELNPGQTERVSTMLRHALKEHSIRDLMATSFLTQRE